ncbi:hypothetical protein [Kineothrix sedimenti]|uniref:XkdX family protein n=1 Tax=Kineothrix sedimenti TaxID=3123317 RepID=A0ABZ3F052_9FIRM
MPFWYDYEKYGYTDDDFQDNVVADVTYEEVVESKRLTKVEKVE